MEIANRIRKNENRMYENAFPEINDTVMVEIASITQDIGIEVHLLEYGNCSGFVPFSELSRKRMKSISQYAKIGKIEPMIVIDVNKIKEYITLSKKYVDEEMAEECNKRYQHSKILHSMIHYTSQKFPDYTVQKLNEMIVWPLYKTSNKHPYFSFRKAQHDFGDIFPDLKSDVPDIANFLEDMIKRRFADKPISINATISVNCFTSQGVKSLKVVLDKLYKTLQMSSHLDSDSIEIKLIKPPFYSITSVTFTGSSGIKELNEILHSTVATALNVGVTFKVVNPVSTADQTSLEESENESEEES